MADDFWSVAQACVWAETHDIQAVDRTGEDGPAVYPDGDALFQIPGLCAQGILTLYGRYCGNGNMQRIPQDAWAGLRIIIGDLGIFGGARGFIARQPDGHSRDGWWTNLRMLSAEAVKAWPVAAVPAHSDKDRGGRPRRINWDEAFSHLVAVADLDGLQEDEIAKTMADFFMDRYGDAPADSAIREKAAMVKQAMRDLTEQRSKPKRA